MIGVVPGRGFTLRKLFWMLDGREANEYQNHLMLAGIFNRLGDGKSSPFKIKPPRLVRRAVRRQQAAQLKLPPSASDIEIIREMSKQFFNQRC